MIRLIRGQIGVVCALVATTLVLAPAALAITRDQANRIALMTLKPEAELGRVVLFGLSGPLPATAAVFEGGTARLTRGPTTVTVNRLGRRAWLFSEDLAYDARFQHPSRLLVIDDRTGPFLLGGT